MNAGIIAAAGRSDAMGGSVDRAFLTLGSAPLLAYSLQAFERCADIDSVIVIVRKERIEAAHSVARMFGCSKLLKVIPGAAKRQVSIENALGELDEEYKTATVHDVTRPCVTPDMISKTIKSAKRYGTGITAARTEDVIKQIDKGQVISKTLNSKQLWISQTPQSFKINVLTKGYQAAAKKKLVVEDDASAAELVESSVRIVPSTLPNMRISTADDLALAAALLRL